MSIYIPACLPIIKKTSIRHIGAAVAPDIRFQRVFRLALNGAELPGKAVDQRVALDAPHI